MDIYIIAVLAAVFSLIFSVLSALLLRMMWNENVWALRDEIESVKMEARGAKGNQSMAAYAERKAQAMVELQMAMAQEGADKKEVLKALAMKYPDVAQKEGMKILKQFKLG